MAGKVNRRALLKKGALWTPALGAAALAGPAFAASPASADSELRSFGIVGTWTMQVTLPEIPSFPGETGLYVFGGDGITTGTSGGNKIVGFGTWKPTGIRTFLIDYRHFVIDDEGVITGDVRVSQKGVLNSRDRFTADGPVNQYDLEGNVVATQQTHTVGTRYGF